MTLVLSTAYFPPVHYFTAISREETIYLEAHENFTKQSYRNRCQILTAQGSRDLVVPVKHGKGKKIPIIDVQIDYDQPWQKNHWKSIETAYNRSPFFEFYKDHLIHYFEKRYDTLFEMNHLILEQCFPFLRIKKTILTTLTHQHDYPSDCLDLRSALHPKLPLPIVFNPKTYPQVFDDRQSFQPGLSILDLLFSQGPNAWSKL